MTSAPANVNMNVSLEAANFAPPPDDMEDRPAELARQLAPRERAMLWLAYVEGFSHREISAQTGLKEASIRPLLYRARQRLAVLLDRAEVTHG